MANQNLGKAKKAKNDEFYTQLADIDKEMQAYIDYNPDVFRDKTILLPCDDPKTSNFTKFFAANFQLFGIKKLISTSYAPDAKKAKYDIAPSLFPDEENDPKYDPSKWQTKGKIFVLDRDVNGDSHINIDDLQWKYLEGDGDFRSREVMSLRDEADIIITNPPFSMFREFLKWIMDAGKQFSIIGNMNAITYKEVFPLIKDSKIWLGNGFSAGNAFFATPNAEKYKDGVLQSNGLVKFRNCCWYTNIEHGRRHQPLTLMTMADNKKFSPHKSIKENGYQHYDNYDAIEVPYTDAIPSDYDGVMGVPISFLDKYCPEQFEIVNANDYRTSENVRIKPHGLIKDKEATITIFDGQNAEREREREETSTHNVRTDMHQTNCLLREVTDGTLTVNANTHVSLSASYYDMVARPVIAGREVYRRVFIRKN